MKYFQISEKIDKDLIEKFFNFCNDNIDNDWTITIWTLGGMQLFGCAIINAINNHHKTVNLIGLSIYSCGFEIFYHAKCNKFLTKHSLGMYHVASADMRINSKQKPHYDEDAAVLKNINEGITDENEFVKFMTKKELCEYHKGEEVYFTAKRLTEIFPDAIMV